MGSIPYAKARRSRTWSGGWRGPGSLAAAPVPSLTVAWAPPPRSARLRLCDHWLDPGRPERHPGAVIHRPRLGDQASHLDRVALADARGQARHLDGQDLGLALG